MMFGNANKRARKKGRKAFKQARRDMFEGLNSEGRAGLKKALQQRLTELQSRPKSDIEQSFKSSPFVKNKVRDFQIMIDAQQAEMKKKATKTLQSHIDTELSRYEKAKKDTDVREKLIQVLNKAVGVVAADLVEQKQEVEALKDKKVKLKKAAKKLNERLARIAASNAVDAAAQARKAKDKIKELKAQVKEVEKQEHAAQNSVLRLVKEQARVRTEIEDERQGLEDFRDELDIRDEANYDEETKLRIRNLNQMVHVSRQQVFNTIEQIMVSHPVSVKSVGTFFQNEFKGIMEGYALLCENTADVLAMNATIMTNMKETGIFMDEGVEVFAFAESAEEYLLNMVEIMQDLTEKATRASTALAASGETFNRVKKFFNGIKPNMPPYQCIAFALSVRDNFYTLKEESREIERLMGNPMPDEADRFIKSRIAKYIGDAEDISGTTPDGLIQRIANSKLADEVNSPLLWYRDTNEQYNEIIGGAALEPEFDAEYAEYTTPRVGAADSPKDPTAAARIGADYVLPELQKAYDDTKEEERKERDRLKGIMDTDVSRIKKLGLGKFASDAIGSASELLEKRIKLASKDPRIKTNPGKRKKR